MSADKRNAKLAAYERAVKAARAVQAREVMPLIGPLLDAWEEVPNDMRSLIADQCPQLAHYLSKIDDAMQADIGRITATESASQKGSTE